MMKRITSLSVVAVFCMSAVFATVFAETIYLKNGDIIENAVITEITQTEIRYRIGERATVYTISKSDALRVVHADGGEDVFDETSAQEQSANQHLTSLVQTDGTTQTSEFTTETRIDTGYYRLYFGYSSLGTGAQFYKNNFFTNDDGRTTAIFGYGLGLAISNIETDGSSSSGGAPPRPTNIDGSLVASADLRLPIFPNLEHQFFLGLGLDFGLIRSMLDNVFSLYAGYQYDKWLFELGYSRGLFLRAGIDFIGEKEKTIDVKDDEQVGYFRPGIEFFYPIYRSDFKYWDNEFPYLALAAGVFLRIGPEPVYVTTGAYLKVEAFEKEYTAGIPVNIMGIPIGSIPLIDLTVGISNWSVEVPILLNYMLSKQVRFTAGALLDFRVGGWCYMEAKINEDIPWVGGSTIWELEDQLDDMYDELAPTGNLYWALGLDFDIVKNWGIGLKYIIHNNSFGGSDMYQEFFERSQHQIRLSTYFVF